MGVTRINTSDILNGTILEEDIADNAITPVKADLTATWNFGLGAGSTLLYKTPTSGSEVAIKSYVDAVAQGIRDPKDAVLVTTDLQLSLTGTQTVDGVSLIPGDRVLVRANSGSTDNGIYTVSAGAWLRAEDADEDAEVTNGLYTLVTSGSNYSSSGWILSTPDPIILEQTGLTFVQFNGAGQLTAGSGLTKTGNTFDVGQGYGILVSPDSVAVDDTVVGNLTGTNNWTGTNVFSDISGSLFKTKDGLSYIVGGLGVTVDSGSNDQIVISSTAAENFADRAASYVVVGLTSSLPNERALNDALGIKLDDNGANANLDVRIDESVVPTLTASNVFTSQNQFTLGLSGSLTNLTDGRSYLVGSTGINVTSGSNDQVIVSVLTSSVLTYEKQVYGDELERISSTIYNSSQNFKSGSLRVYRSGMRMIEGGSNDYTITGLNEITFTNNVPAISNVVADYALD